MCMRKDIGRVCVSERERERVGVCILEEYKEKKESETFSLF